MNAHSPSTPSRLRRPLIVGAILTAVAAVWLAIRGIREPDVLPPGLPEPASTLRQEPAGADPNERIAHNGIFAALGRATYRHRRWLPLAGLALVIGLNAWAAVAGGRLSQGGWQVPGSEALRAEELFTDRFGETAS